MRPRRLTVGICANDIQLAVHHALPSPGPTLGSDGGHTPVIRGTPIARLPA